MPSLLLKPVPHTEAAQWIADKPILVRQAFDQLVPDLKARAMTITGVEDANVMQAVRDRIAELPQGADWDEAKKDIAAKISPWLDDTTEGREASTRRAELLLRTHGFESYAVAAEEVGARQRDAFPFCQYLDSDDDSVRDSHAALDGIVLPADHPFWENHTPPWEWGCRCQKVWLTREDVAEMQRQDSRKPPEARRVLDGERLKAIGEDRLITTGPGGVPRFVDVSPSGTFTFNPRTIRMGADELRGRYDPEVWRSFEEWARAQQFEDGRNVWSWLQGTARPQLRTPNSEPQTPVVPASPAPSAPEPETRNPEPAVPSAAASAPRRAPVSAALDVQARATTKKAVETTLAAIDKVHDDGQLPKIPLVDTGIRRAYGQYQWKADGTPHQIAVSPRSPWRGMTAAHEAGHFLDHQVLGRAGSFASTSDPLFAKFRDVAGKSASITEIGKLGHGQRGYFLETREIWARAYAQYIAVRSGDKLLLGQLDKIRSSRQPWRQWSDEDFKPIAEAIDEIFRTKGWLK